MSCVRNPLESICVMTLLRNNYMKIFGKLYKREGGRGGLVNLRQCGRVVRTPRGQEVLTESPATTSIWSLCYGRAVFNSSVTFVNSQLVCLLFR